MLNQSSQLKLINKEKVLKMKEIKKYLDQFFKEIKEIQKEILSLTEQSINEPESKRDI